MNDQYYRKKKTGSRSLSRSLSRMLKRGNVLKLGAGALILGFVFFGNRGIIQRINLEMEQKRMVERIDEAKVETEELREQLNRVSDDNSVIERIARERYGMIRSGDTVYRVVVE